MIVARTVEGNHMRQHREGGRSNQRELDAIAEEVIQEHCSGFAEADIGVTTPYRRQAIKAADVLDQIDRYAEREGFTRSGFLAQAARKAMAA